MIQNPMMKSSNLLRLQMQVNSLNKLEIIVSQILSKQACNSCVEWKEVTLVVDKNNELQLQEALSHIHEF